MKLKIVEMDHLGNGIGKDKNKVIFVPKTVVGDISEVDIILEHKNYSHALLNEIIEKSSKRQDAICPYYYECGGCQISNLRYDDQLTFKKNKVQNIFKKYLDKEIDPQIIGSDEIYHYRNKITYQSDGKRLFLVGLKNDAVLINSCLLVSDRVNELFNLIKKENLQNVKKIIIKECDNGLILSIQGKMNIDKIAKFCLSIYQDNRLVYYKEDGYITLNKLKYRVSNRSFFQVNTKNIMKLYDVIIKYGNFTKNDRVIDLYCGVGSISLYIAKYVGHVLGIEIVNEAIDDAWENAKLNNIQNVEFLCGDVSKLIDNNLDFDTVIIDPPRTGLDDHTIDVLNKICLPKIIYVSCEPMTLVRDLKKMTNYQLKDITLVDMFPQTHHVECVCVLNRR